MRLRHHDRPSRTSYVIHVTDAIPAIDDDGTATSVKISARTWLEVQPYFAQGKVTIGWLHSHPNLRAFFSGTDRNTQRSLFHADYNLGCVVDWVRGEEAWLSGRSRNKCLTRKKYRTTITLLKGITIVLHPPSDA